MDMSWTTWSAGSKPIPELRGQLLENLVNRKFATFIIASTSPGKRGRQEVHRLWHCVDISWTTWSAGSPLLQALRGHLLDNVVGRESTAYGIAWRSPRQRGRQGVHRFSHCVDTSWIMWSADHKLHISANDDI